MRHYSRYYMHVHIMVEFRVRGPIYESIKYIEIMYENAYIYKYIYNICCIIS